MNDAIRAMLKRYEKARDPRDSVNALREIIQQLVLLGLQRGGLFTVAAFYGGTALRILYDLDRFSEDMDFCLTNQDLNFSFRPYFTAIIDELERYGFSAEAAIESAFVKQDTIAGLITIGRNHSMGQKGQLIKVRLEADKTNPPGAIRTQKLVKLPVPFMVSTLDEPSLFAGKIHALLARAYMNRVKGRDYYDFLFYMSRETPVNLTYLEAKLRDSGHYQKSYPMNRSELLELLSTKFRSVDFEKAKADVRPFIRAEKHQSLDDWCFELFVAMAEDIKLISSQSSEN